MWQKPNLRYLLLIASVCSIMATANAADYRRYFAISTPTLTWGQGGFGIIGMKGVFEIYSFRPDGSYILWRDNESGRSRDSGTYSVSGNRVILHGMQGELVGTISDNRRSITIGSNVYEVSGDSPPPPLPVPDCRSNCGKMFSDCAITNRPYSDCSNQLESCLAACR